jgi:hypothetical protein
MAVFAGVGLDLTNGVFPPAISTGAVTFEEYGCTMVIWLLLLKQEEIDNIRTIAPPTSLSPFNKLPGIF